MGYPERTDLRSQALAKIAPWVFGHHYESEGSHVFAVITKPLYFQTKGLPEDRWEVNIELPIGPLPFGIEGWVNTQIETGDLNLFVTIPLMGRFNIAGVQAKKHDITGKFQANIRNQEDPLPVKVPGVLSGKMLPWYSRDDKTLRISYSLEIFGRNYKQDVKLVPFYAKSEFPPPLGTKDDTSDEEDDDDDGENDEPDPEKGVSLFTGEGQGLLSPKGNI